jgi:peptidoglycan/LPS O-acetylase OafA/YrhL
MIQKKSRYIPCLDGIRALSFLTVFVSHAGLDKIVPGGFGVTVFFFLSGYLITTLLRLEFEKTQTISLRAFYLRRVLRIFPPLYITLCVGLAFAFFGLVDGKILLGPVLAGVSHLTNYWNIFTDTKLPGGLGILWSLAVEEHFYAVFPVLYLLLSKRVSRKWRIAVLGLICAVVLIWRIVLVYHFHAPSERTYLATDTRIDNILFGCILAIGLNPLLDDTTAVSFRKGTFMVALGLGALLFSFLFRGAEFRETFRYTLQGLGLFPLFFFVLRWPTARAVRWLELPVMRYLGTISYTLYLIHYVMLHVAEKLVYNPIVQGLLALAWAVGFATLMHHAIERPITRFRSQMEARKRDRTDNVSPSRASYATPALEVLPKNS